MGELRMRDSGSSGGKVLGRFGEPARRILDLAREEAERCGHRYLGPEHVLLGMLVEGLSGAARVLRAAGVDLATARAGLGVDLDRLRAAVAVELGGIRP
jgi:ATP-dependent Clp protease ATP-binding subunit ClpA